MLQIALKRLVGIFFNILNLLLAGNLPPFACVCAIVEEDDRFLVVERPDGTFAFPGGFMRWKEQPEETVIREGLEETGLQLHVGKVIGHYVVTSQQFDRMSTLNLAYLAEVAGGTLRGSSEGQPHWVHLDELRAHLKVMYQIILDDYLRYRTQSTDTDATQA